MLFSAELSALWPVCRDGYEVCEGRLLEGGRERRDHLVVPRSIDVEYKDISKFPGLFCEFERMKTSPDDILAFTRKYGVLVQGSVDFRIALPASLGWRFERSISAFFWRRLHTQFREDVRRLRLDIGARRSVDWEMNDNGLYTYDRRNDRLSFLVRPCSLLGALRVQAFREALDIPRDAKSCEFCGRVFQIGAGHKRRDAKFCRRKCQNDARNIRRR